MPVSINKAQALAIADGFDLGGKSNDDYFFPRQTISELVLIAGEFIDDAQKNLIASNSTASGKLSQSLQADPPIVVGNVMKINIEMLPYGLFVNAGVKGTKSGSSTAGYSFKKDFPGKAFIDSIEDWIGRGKMSTSNTNAKKTISANEKKNASIGSIISPYAVARSIMQKGLKPTGFLDKAIKTAQDKVSDRLGLALEIDITKSLSQ